VPVQSLGSKLPHKRRKYSGPHHSPSQTQFPSKPPNNSRFYHGLRPPKGPRGYTKSARNYSTSQQVEYHDGIERSTSRDHERLSWRASGSGTPSTDIQSQSVHGRGGYQYPSNAEPYQFDFRNRGGLNSFVEPKREGSAPRRRIYNRDAAMDVDSNDITQLEQPLPMADPMFPVPQIAQDGVYSDDSVLVRGDTLHGAGTPMDHLPVPVEDQENDQNWEDGYEIPEEHAVQALAPEFAPQSAPAASGPSNPIFNADDSMADVTDNPWAS